MHVHRTPLVFADPFASADLASHLRVDPSSELLDESLRLARASVAEIEKYGQLALLDQRITVNLPCWPGGDLLSLPVTPGHHLAPDVQVTVDGETFAEFVYRGGFRPEVWLTGRIPAGVVQIAYNAGFGETAAQVPEDLRHAIMDQAAAFFDQRGLSEGTPTGMSPHAARIVARYRRVGF
jgi:uncharacterized phiE125 gp8 family phage protein